MFVIKIDSVYEGQSSFDVALFSGRDSAERYFVKAADEQFTAIKAEAVNEEEVEDEFSCESKYLFSSAKNYFCYWRTADWYKEHWVIELCEQDVLD